VKEQVKTKGFGGRPWGLRVVALERIERTREDGRDEKTPVLIGVANTQSPSISEEQQARATHMACWIYSVGVVFGPSEPLKFLLMGKLGRGSVHTARGLDPHPRTTTLTNWVPQTQVGMRQRRERVKVNQRGMREEIRKTSKGERERTKRKRKRIFGERKE
jgi:hypothetical protein